MKKRFNIIIATMFAVLLLNFLGSFVYYAVVSYDMVSGIDEKAVADFVRSDFNSDDMHTTVLNLIPLNSWKSHETVVNSLTGDEMPVIVTQAEVAIRKTAATEWTEPFSYAVFFVLFVCYVAAVWLFIKFFLNINRFEIFTWKNIRLLRYIGGLLIAIFVFNGLAGLCDGYIVSQSVAVEGRAIDWFHSFSVTTLLLGFFCLIMAEAFAMGLRQREELELTI